MKKAGKPVVEHLTPEAMKLLLDQPDRNHPRGRRDLTLMSVLYDTGARVQELIDVKVGDSPDLSTLVIETTTAIQPARRQTLYYLLVLHASPSY